MKIILLAMTFLKDLIRQKTIIFSSFILPIVIIWSTWWVTADIAMQFHLDSGIIIVKNMIDIHVITGGLTAMAITSGLFGFVITSDYEKISQRLRQVGYSPIIITLSILLTLLVILMFTSFVAIALSIYLADEKNIMGLVISILLVTLIYTALGNIVGTVFTNFTTGSLLILIFSFMDLMLFTNPMGEGLYLQPWTYYTPGFWPVQIALEAGFVGFPDVMADMVFKSLLYFLILIGFSFVLKKMGLTWEVRE